MSHLTTEKETIEQLKIESKVKTQLPANSCEQVKKLAKDLQEKICQGLEAIDGQATFQEDNWERDEGGGGCTQSCP